MAVNTISLVFVPMNIENQNRICGVSGFLGFLSHVGAALASVLTGVISGGGWLSVIFIWIVVCAGTVVLSQRLRKR